MVAWSEILTHPDKRREGRMSDNAGATSMSKQADSSAGKGRFVRFATFRTMITPIVIQVIFWLAELGNLIFWVWAMTNADKPHYDAQGYYHSGTSVGLRVVFGLICLMLGAIIIRVYLEVIMVVFKINDNVSTLVSFGSKSQVVDSIPAGSTSLVPPASAAATREAAEEALRALTRLRDDGLVSDEEYEAKRSEIISRL